MDEDSFIFFRCAENIVSDHGYSFNAGDRIEACSSVTWLFLLIVLLKSGWNLLTASKLLGIVFGCLSLILIYAISRCFTRQMPWVILPSFLTSCSLPFLLWNQMGLETSIYTFVFLSLILICLKKDLFIYWPVISLLLVLTRPEGVFLLLGLLPVFYIYRGKRREIIFSSLLFFVLFLIIILARLFYFHDFLPNPFYTKIYARKFSEGLLYVHTFFKDHYMYLFLVPLLYLIWKRWNWEKNRIILLGFTTAYLLWVVLGGSEGIFKPFFRHLVPAIPALYIYSVTGIERTFDGHNIAKRIVYVAILFLGFITLLIPGSYTPSYVQTPNPVICNIKKFFQNPGGYLHSIRNRFKDPEQFNSPNEGENHQILLGEFIKCNYKEGSKLIYDQMGRTPYQAGVEYFFIDSWGLTDKVIGRYYFHQNTSKSTLLQIYEKIAVSTIDRLFPNEEFINTKHAILDYIFRKEPDVILVYAITCYLRDYLPHWIIMDSRFKNTYHLQYFIHGTLVFEKNGLKKKPLSIPDGLSVVFDKDIYSTLIKDTLIQDWGRMVSDDFWEHRSLADWLSAHSH
jgi:hypothetical protein